MFELKFIIKAFKGNDSTVIMQTSTFGMFRKSQRVMGLKCAGFNK